MAEEANRVLKRGMRMRGQGSCSTFWRSPGACPVGGNGQNEKMKWKSWEKVEKERQTSNRKSNHWPLLPNREIATYLQLSLGHRSGRWRKRIRSLKKAKKDQGWEICAGDRRAIAEMNEDEVNRACPALELPASTPVPRLIGLQSKSTRMVWKSVTSRLHFTVLGRLFVLFAFKLVGLSKT